MALGQSYYCPSANGGTLKDMGKYTSLTTDMTKTKQCTYYIHTCSVYIYILYIYTFTHILQGNSNGIGAIILLPQCQWRNPEGYG